MLKRPSFRLAYLRGRPRWDSGIMPPEVVEAHGGAIRADAGPGGKGTRMAFSLPNQAEREEG